MSRHHATFTLLIVAGAILAAAQSPSPDPAPTPPSPGPAPTPSPVPIPSPGAAGWIFPNPRPSTNNPKLQAECEAKCAGVKDSCGGNDNAFQFQFKVANAFNCLTPTKTSEQRTCTNLQRLLLQSSTFIQTNESSAPTTVCEQFSKQCVTFCLNPSGAYDNVEAPVIGGTANAEVDGAMPAEPMGANVTNLFSEQLLFPDELTGDLVELVFHADFISRAAGWRSVVHYHPSPAMTCVLTGCVEIVLDGEEPVNYCARADGMPTCFGMAAWHKMVNINAFNESTTMIDFGVRKPGVPFLTPLEPMRDDSEPTRR